METEDPGGEEGGERRAEIAREVDPRRRAMPLLDQERATLRSEWNRDRSKA